MKTPSIIVFAGGLVLPSMLHAQDSPANAPGHFCATYDDAMPEDCSFTSMSMCEQSVRGLGGYCAPQADAPVMPPSPMFRLFAPPQAAPPPVTGPAPAFQWLNPPPPAAFAPAAVPPPPEQQQPSDSLQPPDFSQTQR